MKPVDRDAIRRRLEELRTQGKAGRGVPSTADETISPIAPPPATAPRGVTPRAAAATESGGVDPWILPTTDTRPMTTEVRDAAQDAMIEATEGTPRAPNATAPTVPERPTVPEAPSPPSASPVPAPASPLRLMEEEHVDILQVIGFQLRQDAPVFALDPTTVMAALRQASTYQQGQVDATAPTKAPTAHLSLWAMVRQVEWRAVFRGIDWFPARGILLWGGLIALAIGTVRVWTAPTIYYAQLSVDADSARSVSVVGDFNAWGKEGAAPMQRVAGSGRWEGWVRLEAGKRYRYRFQIVQANGTLRTPGVDPTGGQSLAPEMSGGVVVVPVHGGPPLAQQPR